LLIENLKKQPPFNKKKCVAHFHEWLAGTGLLYLKHKKTKIGTVFTTHATTLGRTLSSADVDLYKMIAEGHDGDQNLTLAKRYNISAKYTMELSCAKQADVFTTVSKVTGRECEYILERMPDILLLNGLDTGRYPLMDELTILRRKHRMEMRHFLASYFRRYYHMDLMDIRTFFISGRYEYKNKGLDIYITALGKLNERLRKEKSKTHALAFIFVPAENRGENIQVLKNKALYEEMKDHVEEELPEIKKTILASLTDGKTPHKILSDDFLKLCRETIQHFTEKKGETPPLCAFDLTQPETNKIVKALTENKLTNKAGDRVKVIYYPAYLSAADRLIGMDYSDSIMTCDVGVFPSYYEPWGYTPLECAVLGVISVTTDLAGFGKFIEGRGSGIYVLKREGRPFTDIVSQLSDIMYKLVTMSKTELSRCRRNAKELAAAADWKELIRNYIVAHDMAVKKTGK